MESHPTYEQDSRRVYSYLAVFIGLAAAVVFGPMAFRLPGRGFDSAPLDQIRKSKPDYVFIGHSMTFTRISPDAFPSLGASAEVIIQDPSVFGTWFLALKNYVIASKHRPKMVFTFFRDAELTTTGWSMTALHLWQIERYRHFDEPVFERLAFPNGYPFSERVLGATRRFYSDAKSYYSPPGQLYTKAKQTLESAIPRIVANRSAANTFLARAGRRPAAIDEIRADTPLPSSEDFPEAVKDSWLENYIAAAQEADVPICFVRVRRAPKSRPVATPILVKYLSDLRTYLAAKKVCFMDEHDEPAVPDDWYVGPADDHIAYKHRDDYTRWFASEYLGRLQ